MNELIVEGLTPEDFRLLQKIISTYNISVASDIKWDELIKLLTKIEQINNALST
jgi:hypothetical protein